MHSKCEGGKLCGSYYTWCCHNNQTCCGTGGGFGTCANNDQICCGGHAVTKKYMKHNHFICCTADPGTYLCNPQNGTLNGAGCENSCQSLPSGFQVADVSSQVIMGVLKNKRWETCAMAFSNYHAYWTYSGSRLTTNGLTACSGGRWSVRFCYLRVMISAPCVGCYEDKAW